MRFYINCKQTVESHFSTDKIIERTTNPKKLRAHSCINLIRKMEKEIFEITHKGKSYRAVIVKVSTYTRKVVESDQMVLLEEHFELKIGFKERQAYLVSEAKCEDLCLLGLDFLELTK